MIFSLSPCDQKYVCKENIFFSREVKSTRRTINSILKKEQVEFLCVLMMPFKNFTTLECREILPFN